MEYAIKLLQLREEELGRLWRLPGPLLGWYARNARDLPWRQTADPYRIWVSEIMLQQTRVEAVRDYYLRFLEALPTLPDLANASGQTLLKLWEGLGYYNRARNLQKAARLVLERYGGELPASYEQLLGLPGIGEYTAGAVGSIAFGLPVPAVDGNVLRVVSRLLESRADISSPGVRAGFRALLLQAVPQDAPGDFNQALMELGALLCLPKAPPACGECPAAGFCLAKENGSADELPVKAAKKARRIERRTVLLVVAGERTLLEQRESGGLLAGMWQPFNLEGELSPEEARGYLERLGANPGLLTPLGAHRHVFTHVEWRMTGYLARLPEPFAPPEGAVWASGGELREAYPLPSAFLPHKKLLYPLLRE